MPTSDTWTAYGIKVQQQLAALKKEPYVQIGIQGAKAAEAKKGSEELSLIDVAVINEFGSSDGRVPARSFIRAAHDEFKDRWMAARDRLFKQAMDGDITVKEALAKLGLLIRNDIKKRIRAGIQPWNALATILKKSRAGRWGNMPLIDRGQLINGITDVSKNID